MYNQMQKNKFNKVKFVRRGRAGLTERSQVEVLVSCNPANSSLPSSMLMMPSYNVFDKKILKSFLYACATTTKSCTTLIIKGPGPERRMLQHTIPRSLVRYGMLQHTTGTHP